MSHPVFNVKTNFAYCDRHSLSLQLFWPHSLCWKRSKTWEKETVREDSSHRAHICQTGYFRVSVFTAWIKSVKIFQLKCEDALPISRDLKKCEIATLEECKGRVSVSAVTKPLKGDNHGWVRRKRIDFAVRTFLQLGNAALCHDWPRSVWENYCSLQNEVQSVHEHCHNDRF